MNRFGLGAFVASAILLGSTGQAVACGFDGLLGNSFAAQHPRSIEVAFAIHDAVAAGAIDRSALDPVVPGPTGYWRAVGRIDAFQRRLAVAGVTAPVAILLIDSALWSRLVPGTRGFDIDVHVDGSEPGDVVIVTSEAVLAALIEGHLTIDDTIARGLLAFDGGHDDATQVRSLLLSLSASDVEPARVRRHLLGSGARQR